MEFECCHEQAHGKGHEMTLILQRYCKLGLIQRLIYGATYVH